MRTEDLYAFYSFLFNCPRPFGSWPSSKTWTSHCLVYCLPETTVSPLSVSVYISTPQKVLSRVCIPDAAEPITSFLHSAATKSSQLRRFLHPTHL